MGNSRRNNMVFRNTISCITFLACFIFLSCSKSNPVNPTYSVPIIEPLIGKTYSADEITAFKQLTISQVSNGIIVKLPVHVSVYLADTAYPYMTKELDSIIIGLNRLLDTNLIISRTNDRSTSTIQVYLTDRDTYINQEPSVSSALQNSLAVGYGYVNWNGSGGIYHGSAFVDMVRTVGDTLLQRYVIHHEMMHALGFIGHVSLPQFYTIMFYLTSTPYILDYTSFDKRMMLLLYNASIKSGMSETGFNEAVKNL
jgi:Protein of unknown function (DUF2927)